MVDVKPNLDSRSKLETEGNLIIPNALNVRCLDAIGHQSCKSQGLGHPLHVTRDKMTYDITIYNPPIVFLLNFLF